MSDWYDRHRQGVHGVVVAGAVLWLVVSLAAGDEWSAVIAAGLAVTQAMLLQDARKARTEPPPAAAPAPRRVGFAMLAAGVACIASVAVILLVS